ncbi:hypothetical protein BS17DRAFT_705155 [Gyrodon lividus]|nr:hypothetical protein BS17DRAFT_705155 [Gyrodon lividus]
MLTLTLSQLKEQGNALFVKKGYLRAHEKYTEAIAIDRQNAVLYANRSACSPGMAKFLGAWTDAVMASATELDPGYAKGWSRRACAHDALVEWSSCVEAWPKALDALPMMNLTPAELKQKDQYAASLKKARCQGVYVNSNLEKLPWQVASEMMPELQAAGSAGYASSASVGHSCCPYRWFPPQDFTQGIRYMKQLEKINIKGSPMGYGIVDYLCTVRFACQKRDTWPSESLKVIMEQALERQKKKGCNDVRPALAVTARFAVLNLSQPFSDRTMLADGSCVLFMIILSEEHRGAIFEDTFVRRVRVLYLDALMQVRLILLHAPLLEEATDLLEESFRNSGPTDSVDPGFVSSFCIYPCQRSSRSHVQMKKSIGIFEHYLKASERYSLAGQTYPEDDEKTLLWYLNCAVSNLVSVGAPMELADVTVKHIREAMPKMRRIWADSVLAKPDDREDPEHYR